MCEQRQSLPIHEKYSNIRGSPPYYQGTFYDLLAMLGTPTWFFTLSAADLKWPDMIQTIAKQYGVHYTDEEVASNVFQNSLIDRYQHRPRQIQSMCLANFAATYVTIDTVRTVNNDALPASESDTTST